MAGNLAKAGVSSNKVQEEAPMVLFCLFPEGQGCRTKSSPKGSRKTNLDSLLNTT